MTRSTPIHRSITPADMRALPEPTSREFRQQQWRRERRGLVRWLVIVVAAVAVALAIRILLERRATAAPDDLPAAVIALG